MTWLQEVSAYIERNSFMAVSPAPPSRFVHELDAYLRNARAGSARHAAVIVMHWYQCRHRHKPIHPRVAYYMRRARERFSSDQDRDRKRALRKALGLSQGRKGSHGIREDAKQYAIEAARELRTQGEKEDAALEQALQRAFGEFGLRISKRTIRESDTRPFDQVR